MRRLFRLARIVFHKMQYASGMKISDAFKYDAWYNTLTHTEHQRIGKIIAKYNDYFVENSMIPVKIQYSYTDKNGNGIYK